MRPSFLSPGIDTIDGHMEESGQRKQTATIIHQTERIRIDSVDVIRIAVTHISAQTGDTGRSTFLVDPRTLAMIEYRVRARTDSCLLTYTNGRLSGWVVPPKDTMKRVDIVRATPTFPDDGVSPWIIRCLPFEADSIFHLSLFNVWMGRDLDLTYRVVDTDTLAYRDQRLSCWKVQVHGRLGPPGYDYFAWVDREEHRILQTAFEKPGAATQYGSRLR